LQRDRTDLAPDGLSHRIGRDVRLGRNRPQDSQSLGCYLNAPLSKEISRLVRHIVIIDLNFE
jgi:hypothetical protein